MIAILLATYNGARYLSGQLDSLFRQTEQDFHLYVSDDCSADETVAILGEYADRYPGRISVDIRSGNSGHAKNNFLSMMLSVKDAEYFMLCDQDDVWLPGKIEHSMDAMHALERKYGAEIPLLVYTDLRVTDKELNVISPSFSRSNGIAPGDDRLNSQTVQNTLTGCTALYNLPLARVLRSPGFCTMHDSWLMQTAVALGHTAYLPEATVLYRQHGANRVGAKRVRSPKYILRQIAGWKEVKKSLNETYTQAESFLRAYDDLLTDGQKEFLRDYAAIPGHRKLRRLSETVRLRAYKHGFLRRVGQFFAV